MTDVAKGLGPSVRTSAPRGRRALHWAEVEALLLLGLADPVPVAHVLQALLEVVLGCLVVAGGLLGLAVGELEQVSAAPEGAELLKQEEDVLFGDTGQFAPWPAGQRHLLGPEQAGRQARAGGEPLLRPAPYPSTVPRVPSRISRSQPSAKHQLTLVSFVFPDCRLESYTLTRPT